MWYAAPEPTGNRLRDSKQALVQILNMICFAMQNNVSMGHVMPHTQSNENKTQQKQLAMLRLASAVWGQVLKNWGDWQDNG